MSATLHENCFNHRHREAIARCPECRRFFCRECITEHENRVVCASCLRQAATREEARAFRWGLLALPAQFAAGLLLAWLVFYGVGQILTAIPADIHAGAWKEMAEEFLE